MPAPHASASRSRVRRAMLTVAAIAVMTASVVASTLPSGAASTGVTVTLSVPSTVRLDTTGCPVSARTFGTVQPGTTAISGLCSVQFGSTNDSSRLMLYQLDGAGDAMHREAGSAFDTTFGNNGGTAPTFAATGKASLEFPEGDAAPKFTLQQADGKYIQGGTVINGNGKNDVAFARFNANGTPDTAFGGSCGTTGAPSCVGGSTGRLVVTLHTTEFDNVWSGVLQPDGKLLAVGNVYVGGFDNDCVVMRLTTAGLLDSSFGGGDGVAQFSAVNGGGWDDCRGITLLRDGRIMTSGNVWSGTIDSTMARLNPDGSMDTSLDSDGVIRMDIGADDDSAWNIEEVDNQKVLLIGDRKDGATGYDAFITRYNLDGTLDTTYGSGGRTDLEWTAGSGDDYSGQVAFDGAGEGYVAARTNITGDYDMVLYKLRANGTLDPAWGSGTGKLRHIQAGRGNFAFGLVDQGSKALLIGSDQGTAPDANAQVLRMTSSGIDPTFNSGAPLTVDFNGQWDYSTYSTLARDGRVFVTTSVGKAATGKGMFGGFLLGGGTTVPDYGTDDDGAGDGDGDGDNGVSNWASPATQSLFAGCLETRGGTNLAGGWTLDGSGTCTASDSDPWYPIEDALGAPAKVLGTTTIDAAGLDATAGIRFGTKVSSRQPPGAYLAPLGVEVLAPYA